jgi:hypothetical protein
VLNKSLKEIRRMLKKKQFRTSQGTYSISVISVNHLNAFKEIISVYCDNQRQLIGVGFPPRGPEFIFLLSWEVPDARGATGAGFPVLIIIPLLLHTHH